MKKQFEFSYCMGEVDFIENNQNITIEEAEEIVKKLMKCDEIYVGERTNGVITFDDQVQPIIYKVDYEYCSEVGEDWGDDVWEKLNVEVQL